MKKITLIFISLMIIISCNNSKQEDQNNKLPIGNSITRTNFDFVDLFPDYPLIKDTAAFIDFIISYSDFDELRTNEEAITYYKKIYLYGSDKPIYLIEYDWRSGCMAGYPWKNQLFFNENGDFIGSESAESFKMVNVFKDQNPLLMMLVTTGKGFGWHCFYKYDEKKDSLINILVGDDPGDSQSMTYCSNDWYELNEPYELNLFVKDYNSDGYNDIIFYGQRVIYYNYEENHSEGKPLEEYSVEYVFLYDKDKEQFILGD